MTHPLTDEMIEEIAQFEPDLTEPLRLNRAHDMRAAADWQFEQDAEYFAQYLIKIFGMGSEVAEVRVEWFKEEMRPQNN